MRILSLTVLLVAFISGKAFSQDIWLQYWGYNEFINQFGWIYGGDSNEATDTIYVCGRDTISLRAGINSWPPGWGIPWSWSTGDTISQITVNQSGLYECGININGFPGTAGINVVFTDLNATLPASVQMPLCIPPIELNELNTSGNTGDIEFSWLYYEETELGTVFSGGIGGDIILSLDDVDTLCSNASMSNLLVHQTSDTLSMLVRISDENCTIIRYTTILPPSESDPVYNKDLCLVTLDSATQKHKLVWDNMQQTGIVAYRLYRQDNISSNYVLMHEQPIDSLSEYVDTLSNPQQTVSRYQIAAVDSCGTESERYNTHTTVLLSSNQGINNTVNLSWNAYEGFEYPNFEIWRSADGISFTLLSNVPNNTFSFVDNNPLPQGFYQVRVSNPNGCVSSRSSDYNGSVSNVVDNQGNPAGIAAQQQLEASIYPNPSTGVFEVQLATSVTSLLYSVLDATGRILMQGSAIATNLVTLELGSYRSGIYALYLQTPRGITSLKLVKQ